MPLHRWRQQAPLALLLCVGLMLTLLGPRPASIRLVPPGSASIRLVPPGPASPAPAGLALDIEPAGLALDAGPAGLALDAGPAGPARAGLALDNAPAGLARRSVPAGGGFRWPLDGSPSVVRGFDPPAQPWLPGHRGVDLAATPGATVRAAGAGRVRFAGRIAGRPVVSIDHADGLRTTYEPVEPVVAAGEQVSAGDPIGRLASGHPGCLIAACLHWGLRRADVYLDPLALLGLGQVRLLPLA